MDIGTFAAAVFGFTTVRDDRDENIECLVIVLSVNETALDPRDQGRVDISNGVTLVRIQGEGIGKQAV